VDYVRWQVHLINNSGALLANSSMSNKSANEDAYILRPRCNSVLACGSLDSEPNNLMDCIEE
jgi:hypothetical protein